MTAEIAILNKSAIALAADSTVTIGQGDQLKTYNSVNKLFALSKRHPVGAMIFGNASLMGVPWEVIIKQYRQQLGKRSFSKLEEYGSSFVAYIESMTSVFTDDLQRVHYLGNVLGFFVEVMKEELVGKVEELTKDGNTASNADIVRLTHEVIAENRSYLEAHSSRLPYLDEGFERGVETLYGDGINETIAHAFRGIDISGDDNASLHWIAVRLGTGDFFSDSRSGLVIAGYGDDQIFPEIWTISPCLVLNGRLIFRHETEDCYAVSHNEIGALLPFAQKDAVDTFLQGINSDYLSIVGSAFDEMAAGCQAAVNGHLQGIAGTNAAAVADNVRSEVEKLSGIALERVRKHSHEQHINPLLEVISVLPKDELAAMAEALVNLTSVKRKMSTEVETVGGPIDVAVISKGDGFIWIRRKHYFRPELNLNFVQNYSREIDA